MSDYVSYIDSKGTEHVAEHGLNIQWDFDDVEEELTKGIDWEERRYQIAKELFTKMLFAPKENHSLTAEADAEASVELADILIAELKKRKEE